MVLWKPSELKRLRGLYEKKGEWQTDYEFSAKHAKEFSKSPEALRWQVRQYHRVIELTFPKILLLDIETLPILADVWGVRKQFVAPVQIRKDSSMICWSAKWLFGKKVYGEVVTPDEAKEHSDKSIMLGIWNLLNEADVVITHNGNSFDLKRLNWRFLVNGLPKPMFYKSIDTYRVVTENFDPTFGKLDWINSVLGIGRKIETSFKWWKECEDGNQKYLDLMLKYNMQDVHALEELYVKIRPWITNHPNINLYAVDGDVKACPCCSSSELKWSGLYNTGSGVYRGFRCQRCGSIGRGKGKENKL